VIEAVLLDFGGTLDSEGLHWSTQMALAFAAAGLAAPRSELDRAFLAADRELERSPAVAGLGLQAHVELVARLMLRELALPDAHAPAVARAFGARAEPHLRRSRELLAALRPALRLALVSNFTPNLDLILAETGLAPLFDRVVCSATAGCRKPEPAIFQLALDALGVAPRAAAMVGDSLASDIAPAKALGLTTVWIRGDRVFVRADESAADHVAGDLAAALAALRGRAP
jgi:putative hydrolase of the HAD superfamily